MAESTSGNRDLLGDLAGVLRRRCLHGQRTAFLSDATREAFFEPVEGKRRGRGVRPGPRARTKPGRGARARPAPASAAETSPGPVEAAPPDVSGMDMDRLRETVAACRCCGLCEGRTQTVFGDGDPTARLMFIGEGPGREEDEQGIPFVGRAGELLTRMIGAMQFRREEVYIANVVKCRPPGNRNPEREEAETCLPYLRRQIELVAPEVIVLLGAVPLLYLLGQTGVNRLHGTWQEYEGIPVLPTFHPAYLLRLETRKRAAWADLQKVMVRFGKDPRETMRAHRRGP